MLRIEVLITNLD